MEQASLLCLGQLPYSLLSVISASNTLSLVLSMSWNFFKNFFHVKICWVLVLHFCCHCHFWDIFILSSQPLPSFMSISSPLLSSSGSTSRTSQPVAVVSAPLVSYFSYNSIHVQFQFHVQHYHISFLCYAFGTDGQFPLSMIHIVKYHMGLSLGDKEAMQLYALQSGIKLNNQGAMTNHQQILFVFLFYVYGFIYLFIYF